jgi:hypothetical protein
MAQQAAPANAGRASRLQSDTTGPAWLRSSFGKMKDLLLLPALVFLLSACQQSGKDWRVIAFRSSATFHRIVANGHNPAFMEDSTGDAYVEVGAGVSMPERFDRWETLRLYRDGHAERSMLDASGEEIWICDVQTAEP